MTPQQFIASLQGTRAEKIAALDAFGVAVMNEARRLERLEFVDRKTFADEQPAAFAVFVATKNAERDAAELEVVEVEEP